MYKVYVFRAGGEIFHYPEKKKKKDKNHSSQHRLHYNVKKHVV